MPNKALVSHPSQWTKDDINVVRQIHYKMDFSCFQNYCQNKIDPADISSINTKDHSAYIKVAWCTVPFSLFADPERILRRLYVFAEEPCKSTTTTSEPCSPVFKEAQPRPSDSLNLKYHINNLNLYLYVFGL